MSSTPVEASAERRATLSSYDRIQLIQAMARVPYAGSLTLPRTESLTVDDVADWLRDLGSILRAHAKVDDLTTDELRQMQRDVEGLRRLIGVQS